MKNVSRIFRTTAVTGIAALALASCATGTGGSGASAEPSFDASAEVSGELNIMGFGASDEIGESRVESARKNLGEVDIKLIEGDLDIQQFLSAVATGHPPELVYAGRDQLGTFAARGAIMPLNDCIESAGINQEDFREPAMNQVTFEDEVYGIPEFNQVQIIMANADLLDQAGLNLEDVDASSWERVEKAAAAMHKTEGGKLKVIGFDSKLPEFLPIWAKANGVDLLSEDGRTANLNDPAVVEALEFAVGIYDAQGGFPKVKAFRDSADFFGGGNQFATNTLGAFPMEQWYVNILNDVSPDAPVDFTTVKTSNGEPISYSTGSAWAIPADSANPEAACRFIQHMTSTETWLMAAGVRAEARDAEGKPFTGLFTGNQAADEQIREKFVKPAGEAKWDAAIEASYEANDHGFSQPASPADAEFKTAWQDAVNRVLNGQQEPREALEKAQKEAQDALDKAWASWDEQE